MDYVPSEREWSDEEEAEWNRNTCYWCGVHSPSGTRFPFCQDCGEPYCNGCGSKTIDSSGELESRCDTCAKDRNRIASEAMMKDAMDRGDLG